jgi:hypothetical protein
MSNEIQLKLEEDLDALNQEELDLIKENQELEEKIAKMEAQEK